MTEQPDLPDLTPEQRPVNADLEPVILGQDDSWAGLSFGDALRRLREGKKSSDPPSSSETVKPDEDGD